jgi:hypothetical protein
MSVSIIGDWTTIALIDHSSLRKQADFFGRFPSEKNKKLFGSYRKDPGRNIVPKFHRSLELSCRNRPVRLPIGYYDPRTENDAFFAEFKSYIIHYLSICIIIILKENISFRLEFEYLDAINKLDTESCRALKQIYSLSEKAGLNLLYSLDCFSKDSYNSSY